ncbi:hypothetical protein SAMN05444392_103122 [Seinonella peptonophila]|uniref:Uncharacterized protein n=1 Tax=Seinonella peptonophila TaxID=112248 RepID=A0A1M4WAD3_9BACL|nr:hypothetical protein [Seinonella peptonophila]SHE78167.1 hypothetical protein SAMN05444392_103122 [Seinonella peptonophila]
MNLHSMNKMEKWEAAVDNIDWRLMRDEVDRALIENLAAELGFPDFDRLERASELVVDDFYITHLSDGRWAWWNPRRYANEDPTYFGDDQSLKEFIIQFLQLDQVGSKQLEEGLSKVVQMNRCKFCEHEYDPIELQERQPDINHSDYCSTECAMESILGEIKEE